LPAFYNDLDHFSRIYETPVLNQNHVIRADVPLQKVSGKCLV
jgi:hypothetical protein